MRAARVVVVDDDPGVLVLLEETLLDAGFDVVSAGSGEQAVAACATQSPDLVLLDINMPGMDGIQCCAEIRARCGMAFPIVMVTSVDDALSIQTAFEAGASDFILKPINWPLFQRRTESILADWRLAAERNEIDRRVSALQRLAPEQAMLVSRNGVVIEDLKERSDVPSAGARAAYPSLDELYGAGVARRFKQCISAVLKTCKPKSLSFPLRVGQNEREFRADFQVDGRERVIVVVQSVSDKAEAPREVYELAFFDTATGLANQNLLQRHMPAACAAAVLHGRSLAVVSIAVQATAAGVLGDPAIARRVAGLLHTAVRNAGMGVPLGDDVDAPLVARTGESEFVVLLDNVQSGDELRRLVDDLICAFEDDHVEGPVRLEPALGVAVLPSDGIEADVLIHAARTARYEAQVQGATTGFHTAASSVPIVRTLDYARELRTAIDSGELELHFQPRVRAHTGAVTCMEAFVRWNHGIRGYVSLTEFLEQAKATGLILELGTWVLRNACEAAAAWQVVTDIPVSVNLSRQELLREDLATEVADALTRTGLEPSKLQLEVTESALLRADRSPRLLSSLKAIGVGLLLDDFGTGHSSLASLKAYPLDALKIDRSFVARAIDNSADAVICEIIVMMAHKMGLAAIAEGVETSEQLDLLTSLGCDEMQGYLISRPLPPDSVHAYLASADRD
ncbi:MAG: EAL domain-containing protein [Pseudomonadota bacterium]